MGVLTIAPLALTIYILIALFSWFDSTFQPILMTFLYPHIQKPIPGLGIVFGIAIILLAGLLAPSLIGKQALLVTEKIVDKLPLAKMVYSGTKQVFDSFSQSNLKKFNRVVMIRFPNVESYAIGFVTQEAPKGWAPGKPELTLAVFVPTTPNPTGGYLVFVSEKDTIPLNIPVEEALQFIISCGLVKPASLLALHQKS